VLKGVPSRKPKEGACDLARPTALGSHRNRQAQRRFQAELRNVDRRVPVFALTQCGTGPATLLDRLADGCGAAAEFGAEALESMNANVITTLEYARDLSGTTTAAQFVELSSTQARKQYELILKQTGALKSLAETITKSIAE
jgi:hypothetical protein